MRRQIDPREILIEYFGARLQQTGDPGGNRIDLDAREMGDGM